jgi:hypothetical protein
LLEAGQPQQALALLHQARGKSPRATNAVGVCLLRQGREAEALGLFRGLVLAPNGLSVRADVPWEFKANFAAALLASGNVGGGISALGDVGASQHPAVLALREAVRRWKASLSLWERLCWYFGSELDRPVLLDGPLGVL